LLLSVWRAVLEMAGKLKAWPFPWDLLPPPHTPTHRKFKAERGRGAV
jgi:hypothetical protein